MKPKRFPFFLATTLIVAVTITPALHASTFSWDGSDSTDWATGTNWTGDIAPANDFVTDIALFNLASYTNQPNAGTTNITGIQIGDGATSTGALTLSGTSLTIGASGISMLSNAGAATISSPITLAAAQSWTNNSSNLLTISGPAANDLGLTSTGSGNTTLSGSISGTGSLTKTGSGILTLSGTNTYTGGTTISLGTVSISADANLGATSSALSLNGGTLKVNLTSSNITNTHTITVGASGGTVNISPGTGTQVYTVGNSKLTGSGTLTVSGNGTLGIAGSGVSLFQVNATNTGYTGNAIVQDGGIFEYSNSNSTGTGSTFTLNNNGMLSVSTGVTMSKAITVNSGGYIGFQNGNTGNISGAITLNSDVTIRVQDWWGTGVRQGTLSGVVSGSGGLVVNAGTGTGGTVWIQNANNTFTGNITANTSTNIQVNGSGRLGSGNYAGNIAMNGGTFTYASSGTQTFSGVISGTGALAKTTSTSVLTLSGVNTYTGATTVSAGTLALTGSLASTAVTINSGGTLTNNGTIGGAVTVNTGGTLNGSGTFNGLVTVNGSLNPGNSPGIQTYGAGLTLGSASATILEIAGTGGVAGTHYDFINVTGGTLTNDGSLAIVDFGGHDISAQTATYNLFDAVTVTGDFDAVTVDGNALTYNGGTDDWSATVGSTFFNFAEGTGVLSVTVVPEPTTALLGGIGLLGLLRRRRTA